MWFAQREREREKRDREREREPASFCGAWFVDSAMKLAEGMKWLKSSGKLRRNS